MLKLNLEQYFSIGQKKPKPLAISPIMLITPFLVVISSLLFVFSRNLRMDSDHLWSIAVGRWISANGTVPFVDYFSWTVIGEQWSSNSWLFCWMMYHLDDSLGFIGVMIMILCVYLVAGYFLFLLCKRFNPSTISTIAFIGGMFLLIILSVMPRAYIFTLAYIPIIIYLIYFKRHTKLIYLIPLIFLLWANLQSSMRFGIGILFIEALVGTLFFKDRRLWIVLGLSFLATLANPYGFAFWSFSPAAYLEPGTQFIQEWRAVDFSDKGMLILYLFLGATGMFATYRLKQPYDRNQLMILFWFWGAFIYSLTTIRALHYVVLLWAPLFSAFSTRPEKESRIMKPAAVFLMLVLFLFSTIEGIPQIYADLKPAGNEPVSTVEYMQRTAALQENRVYGLLPIGAVNYLKDNPELKENLFNSYIFGGYLLLQEIPVFIDARESVFTRAGVTSDYSNLINVNEDPGEIIKKYNIQTFMLRGGESIVYYLRVLPEWEKVFEDDSAFIITRVGDKND